MGRITVLRGYVDKKLVSLPVIISWISILLILVATSCKKEEVLTLGTGFWVVDLNQGSVKKVARTQLKSLTNELSDLLFINIVRALDIEGLALQNRVVAIGDAKVAIVASLSIFEMSQEEKAKEIWPEKYKKLFQEMSYVPEDI